MGSTADHDPGGSYDSVYQPAVQRSGVFPDAACCAASNHNFHTDISDIVEKSNGKICEQQKIECSFAGDCSDRNRVKCGIAVGIIGKCAKNLPPAASFEHIEIKKLGTALKVVPVFLSLCVLFSIVL